MAGAATLFLAAALAVTGSAAPTGMANATEAAATEAERRAQATAQAAAEARVALHAARLYLLWDAAGGLAHHGLLVRVWRALAACRLPSAAPAAEGLFDEGGAALVVVAAEDGGDARAAIDQVAEWPGESAWLLALPGAGRGEAERALGGAAGAGRVPPGGRVLAVDVAPDADADERWPRTAHALWRSAAGRPLRARPVALNASALAHLWRHASLEGAALRVTTLDYSPMLIFDDSQDPPVVDGFFGQLWTEIQRRLNFTSEWVKPLDGRWGSLQNGSWSGMVSLLLNGSADAAVNAFTLTKARLDAVAFTSSAINTRVSAFVGLRRERAVDWGDYAKPFAASLWAAALLAGVALAVAMVGLHALARRFGDPHAPAEPQCAGPLAAAFYVFGIFCQQGHDITPESLSCRVVYFTAYVTAVTLLAAYSAGLIAFLTVFEVTLPFTTFAEMLSKKPLYRLGMAPSSGVLNTFDQAKDPLLREVYRRLIAPGLGDLPSDHAEVRRRLCEPGARPYAYMRSQILGLSGAGYERCDVTAVPQVSFPEVLAIMLPKRSPLRRLINWHLQELKQQGIHQRILLTFWPKMEPLDENPYSIVGIENVLPVLVILSIGVIMSGVLLLVEIVANKFMQAHKFEYTDKSPEHQMEPEVDNRLSVSSATSVHDRISSGSRDPPEQFHNSMVPIREEIVDLPDDNEIGMRRLRHTVAASTLDVT